MICNTTEKKSSLNLQYYAEVCNDWRSPSPPHSAWALWATQTRRSGGKSLATVPDLIGLGIEPETSRAYNDVLNHHVN